MGNFMATASGFVWGSVVTGIASYIYFSSQRRPQVDEFTLALEKRQKTLRSVDHESVNFLSDLINRLWTHLSPAIGKTIVEAVEPMFKDLLPGPLSSLHFEKCDLGMVPMRFDNIVVHPLKDGKIVCDLDLVWDGGCNIKLKAGKIKLGVKNIKLLGRLQLSFKPLSDVLPCIGAIQYGFINTPSLVLDFTGLGNVADFGGVDTTIRNIIKDSIAGVMVLPQRLAYKMDPNCDYRDAFIAPEGIARITAISGRGFQVEKRTIGKDDVPDCYLKVTIGTKTWTTSVIKDDLEPEWMETADFLLCDKDQIIKVEAWDEDTGALDTDDFLGQTEITVTEMMLAGKTMEVELLDENNVSVGAFVTLHCEISPFAADPRSYSIPPADNHLGGLFTVIVTGAFDLPLTKKDAESFVKIKYGKEEFLTGIVVHYPEYEDYPGYDCLNPVYDVSYVVPITKEMIEAGIPDVTFELTNSWAKQTLLGSLTIPHQEILSAKDNVIKATRKIGSASLAFQVSVHGFSEPAKLDMKKAVAGGVGTAADGNGASQTQQQQQVKVTVVSGQGFKIKKKKLRKNDVPDIYCNVKFGSSPNVWRTATVKDSITPQWNESKVYPLQNDRTIINLQAMDANKRSDDSELGSFRVNVGKVLLNGGQMEVELMNEGVGQAIFVTVACELVNDDGKKNQ